MFGEAKYAPNTPAGIGLLAHELAHVVQQEHSEAAGPSSSAHEREASDAGAQILSSATPIRVSASAAPSVAGETKEEEKNRLLKQLGVQLPEGPSVPFSVEQSARMSESGVTPGAIVLPSVQKQIAAKREEALKAREEGIEEKRISLTTRAKRQPAKSPRSTKEKQHSAKPPRSTKEHIERALIESGVPRESFETPLTPFEIQLQTDPTVRLVYPATGESAPPEKSANFSPLHDPETGKKIGYARGTGGDRITICDLNGEVIQETQVGVEPSAVQPDDLIFLGGSLVKLAGKAGAVAVGSAARRLGSRIPSVVLRRLRRTAAAVMLGTTEAAPVLGGRLGPRPVITAVKEAEERVVTHSGKAAGGRVLKPPPGSSRVALPTTKTASAPAVSKAPAIGETVGPRQVVKPAPSVTVSPQAPPAPGSATVPSSVGQSAKASAGSAPAREAVSRGGAVWEEGRAIGGLTVEHAVGKLYPQMGPVRRMPKNFKGIDFTSGGRTTIMRDAQGKRVGEVLEDTTGISEKTLDLRGKSVATASGTASAIRKHINALYNFEGYRLKGFEVRNLKDRILNLYIGPEAPTAAQIQGINEAIEHAKMADVMINIIRF